jgi:hypothetical protein
MTEEGQILDQAGAPPVVSIDERADGEGERSQALRAARGPKASPRGGAQEVTCLLAHRAPARPLFCAHQPPRGDQRRPAWVDGELVGYQVGNKLHELHESTSPASAEIGW